MDKDIFKNKKEVLINFLLQDASLQLNWAQKKEVAVWAATIFYIGVIYILFQIFLSDDEINKYQGNMIIVVSFNVIFLITITYFIWSNFNSIYNSNAYYLCVKKIIFDLLNNNEIPSLENTDPKVYVHPDIITEELNHRLKSLQPFMKLNRPLIIVFSFWINFILPKRFKINIGRNLAIQEAALYTLIFLSTIILWFLITIDIFC